MGAETRFLPTRKPHSTGIERITQGAPRPTSAGSNATSPVSAAPGVSAATQRHVVDARNPASGRGTPQQARVEIIDRKPGAGHQSARQQVGGMAYQSSVQLIPAPGASGSPREAGAAQAGPAPGRVPIPGWDLQEVLLVSSILERHRDALIAIQDHDQAVVAERALDKLRQTFASRQSAAQAPAPAPSTADLARQARTPATAPEGRPTDAQVHAAPAPDAARDGGVAEPGKP